MPNWENLTAGKAGAVPSFWQGWKKSPENARVIVAILLK